MHIQKLMPKLTTQVAANLTIGALIAASLLLPTTPARGTPADKRKPGLYWAIETDKGKISCKLFEAEAPVTVRMMVGLALGKISYVHPETKQVERKKFFDRLTFDRVIPGVMIQGGDLLGTGVGHPEGSGFPYKRSSRH
jgi:peptidyl-prolyl cis-trans isomerase A (cyclophilin A)